MDKYVKVMFDTTSGADKDLEYKMDEVNIANNWNPTAESGKDFEALIMQLKIVY